MSNVEEKAEVQKKSWWQRNRGKVVLIGGFFILGVGVVVWYKIHGSTSAVTLYNQPLALQMPVQQISETLPITPALTAMSEVQEPVQNILGNRVIQVSGFVRKLHPGWSASEKQRQLAAALGIVIGEGETFVSPSIRKLCA